MKPTTFEIRDRNTFIPVLAIRLVPECNRDRYLLARAGYGLCAKEQAQYIQLIEINGGSGRSECDPASWNSRTFRVAHQYIIDHWGTLESGSVIDVEYILGETDSPKKSEQLEFGQ